MSKPFSLNLQDAIKGAVTAVFVGAALAIGTVLHGVFGGPSFDLFTIDWGLLFKSAANAAVMGAEAGLIGYITKNFISDENGAVLTPFGKIGGTR